MAPEQTANGSASSDLPAPNLGRGGGIQPLDPEEFRKHAHQMVDFVADYYKGIESLPVRSEVKVGIVASNR
jgi:aromatic-L-amino-acid decarboxylase